ncbi:MAG: DNA-3-methyladenine glycosylase [Candidatus Acetothermia bacterium]
MTEERLSREFFRRDTATVAKDLLGKELIRVIGDRLLRGKVVETEAYYGKSDPPSHASSGRTPRSEIMWKEPGLVYVYLVYGIHMMFNVVTEPKDSPGAVLFRAVEPIEGVEYMVKGRGVNAVEDLADGPGKLTEAFRIGKEENGLDLTESEELWLIASDAQEGGEIVESTRIGVSEGKEKKLRFYLEGNQFVSRV